MAPDPIVATWVDFTKLDETFPDLRLQWNVRAGVDELVRGYTRFNFTYDDFTSSALRSFAADQ